MNEVRDAPENRSKVESRAGSSSVVEKERKKIRKAVKVGRRRKEESQGARRCHNL